MPIVVRWYNCTESIPLIFFVCLLCEGIYEGTYCGYPSVIHFQGPITSYVKGGAAASLFCISKCGYRHPKKGGLVISCLDCFSQGKKMFKIRYMMKRDLLTDQDPNWNYLKPGKVIAGYCTKKYYLGQ